MDFHWNASDPWTVVSVSDDAESSGGGGTLQVDNHFRWCYFEYDFNLGLIVRLDGTDMAHE